MNAVIALALGASSLLAVAVADPRVMIESTYTDTKGLNDLAKSMGSKYMGMATDIKQLSDKYYTGELNNTQDFGMITPANAMKWDATEAKQGVFTFEDADKIVAFANKTGAQVRCHALVWHQQAPEWVQSLEKAELLEAMSNHITKVMTHFGDTCYAWDVVNEAIEEDGSYRESFWYKKTGKEYISTAFKTANAVKAKLGLKSKLYYNDYNINVANNKSDAVLKMVTDLRSHKIWVEGVGFQSHYSNNDTVAGSKIFDNFRRFTIKNMDVAITELDVKTSTAKPTVTEQQQQVGIITNAISACKKTKRCVGATVWDFVDTYSWIKSSAPLLFYQPEGPNTPLVRKATYDAVTSGWIWTERQDVQWAPVHLVVLTFSISRFVAHAPERERMNVFISLVLGASLLAVAFGDPRVMIESTYTDTKGLNDLAKTAWQNKGGKYMGTATDIKQLGDPYYIQKLNGTSDFGTITPANAMKWDATEPKQGVFTFEDADKIVAFANKTGAQVRCHTLVWHKQVPEWVQVLEKTKLLEAMSNHITKVMTHFGNSCAAWDVVNEAIDEDGSYRQSFWYKKTGKEYISTAFKTANEVKANLSLQTRLYYNDFNINVVNNKSDAVLEMATDLRSHKIWVEGVGFQSHYSNNDTVAGAKIFDNFRRFTVKHMDVAITELDVKTSTANPTVSEQQQQVGIITNVVSACKKTMRCVGVTVWDFVDTYSWIKSSAPLLFYQPDGPSTPLVRKATYDAVTAGWIL
ncbi:hypothetical protein PC129_g12270 [Phytophthora cactorum]|uniref:endo-1,4-beta-xylanase n=3 Tax=Phytophthora cactorum TaxID=29920 RepID=A0A8T1B5Q6_9STRA|nr:hypothetical protein PC115_g18405 [Phytophthora cactorum]KAG3216878.1 hypothetical protein PC129_g12270 [Phytophthora cactorum]